MARLMGLGSGKNEAVTSYKDLVRCVSTNTGNLVFNFAIENLIRLTQSDIRWATPADEINKQNTPLVLPMANNVGAHTDVSISGPKLKGVNVHKTVMGLGAQFPLAIVDPKVAAEKVPLGTIEWLKTVVNNTDVPNISVRGKFTQQILTQLGFGDFVMPLGCPSHFINSSASLGQTLSRKVEMLDESCPNGIAITAGNPSIKNLHRLEQFFISLINKFDGKYIIQHPESLIRLSQRWVENREDDLELVNTQFFPNNSANEMLSWFAKNSTTYLSVPQWLLDISKYSLCIGTRIHGTQIAIQTGTPAVCFYIDSRTKELCETMHIPAISAHEFQKNPSMKTVFETLKSWDWSVFDENRLRLADETQLFLKQNNLTPQRTKILEL